MSEIDRKLTEILKKLAIQKVDNSFLVGFSFLSLLFGLSNLILNDLFHRQILMIGSVVYFLVSFYIGYLRGAMRDNWGFRMLGWLWMTLSAGVVIESLLLLLMSEAGLRFSVLFAWGFFLSSESVALYLLIEFVKDMGKVIASLREDILSISPIQMRCVLPFVGPFLHQRYSKPTYAAILLFFMLGSIFLILSLFC